MARRKYPTCVNKMKAMLALWTLKLACIAKQGQKKLPTFLFVIQQVQLWTRLHLIYGVVGSPRLGTFKSFGSLAYVHVEDKCNVHFLGIQRPETHAGFTIERAKRSFNLRM